MIVGLQKDIGAATYAPHKLKIDLLAAPFAAEVRELHLSVWAPDRIAVGVTQVQREWLAALLLTGNTGWRRRLPVILALVF
ncbi:hypothetical protein [Stenotrophomonas sp.]|uniref:hypothetical protein n=1 Tax=Stenotrophomonas sp. TaxID=69392 RepID=UPI0028A90327|nr:hypothetical protein [Stenotrophomonas sp.]